MGVLQSVRLGYPLHCTKVTDFPPRLYSLYDATVDDWSAILELAHRWGFPQVKALAVRELEKLEMSAIDRIVLYHRYEVDRALLIPRYAALCEREQPLTLEEGTRLGMETTLNIVRARECARSTPSLNGTRSPIPAMIDAEEMGSIIKDLFGILETIRDSDASVAPETVKSPTAAAKALLSPKPGSLVSSSHLSFIDRLFQNRTPT